MANNSYLNLSLLLMNFKGILMIKYISFIFMLLLLTGCGNGDDGLLGPPTLQ